jgi:hypothetical protein
MFQAIKDGDFEPFEESKIEKNEKVPDGWVKTSEPYKEGKKLW